LIRKISYSDPKIISLIFHNLSLVEEGIFWVVLPFFLFFSKTGKNKMTFFNGTGVFSSSLGRGLR